MKFITLAATILASLSIALADDCSGARECQCLFNDGSHCCVYGSNEQVDKPGDCTAVCSGATRLLQSGEDTPTACNAGGKFSCVGIITAQDRTPCYA